MEAATPSTNGHLNGAAPTLESVRAQRDLVESQIELKRLQHSQKLLESLTWLNDDFGGIDLWDKLRSTDQTQWVPISVPTDRRGGRNWPIWQTEVELADLRQKSRILCAQNPFAKGLLRNLVNYTIGKGGLAPKAISKEPAADTDPDAPGIQEDAQTKKLIKLTQNFIDAFAKQNRWVWRQREAYRRVHRDGECFFRLFHQDDGKTILRWAEPEQVKNPPGGGENEGWTFGMRHQVDPFVDVESILEYYVCYKENPADGEFVDAKDIVHIKHLDEDATVKRGMPAFSLETLNTFERAAKLQRNLSMGGALQAAIAWVEQWQTGTQAEITNYSDSLRDFQKTDPITNRVINQEKYTPGTIKRMPGNMEFKPAPWTQGTTDHLATVQGDLMMAVTAFCAPQYLAGDSSNANYSSSLVSSAPFVKAGEAEQNHFKEAFLEIIWRAVRWAVQIGLLPAMVLTVIDIDMMAPDVIHLDSLQKTQENQIKTLGGWKSKRDCIVEDGKDPEVVFAEIEEETERFGQQGQPLGMPGDEPAGKPDGALPESPGQKPQEPGAGMFGMESAVSTFAGAALVGVPADASRAVLESAAAWLAEQGRDYEPALRGLSLLREGIEARMATMPAPAPEPAAEPGDPEPIDTRTDAEIYNEAMSLLEAA